MSYNAPERGRWDGPPDATLFCPACGTAWHGSNEELAQAMRAQRAWEQENDDPHQPLPQWWIASVVRTVGNVP